MTTQPGLNTRLGCWLRPLPMEAMRVVSIATFCKIAAQSAYSADDCKARLKQANFMACGVSNSPLWRSNPRPYAYEAYALPTALH
eukprot:5697058-Amphidinium_carterae.1